MTDSRWFLVKLRDDVPVERRSTLMHAVYNTYREHIDCVVAAEMLGGPGKERLVGPDSTPKTLSRKDKD